MAEWRIGRGWSEEELRVRLGAVAALDRNFDPGAEMTPELGWRRHSSETRVARERAGPPEPEGPFRRACTALVRYEFSDPRIVTAHFDPAVPLEGRRMLLEMKVLGLRFLAGVAVGKVRQESGPAETVFGFRYDTLAGHIEAGWEWFLLEKSHATGDIRFRIAADWQPGDFPNRWSRIGFGVLGPTYQRRWTRRSHERLRRLLEAGREPPTPERHLLHEGPERIDTEEPQ